MGFAGLGLLEAVRTSTRQYEVQLVNLLTATDVDTDLRINFSSSVEVERKSREYKPRSNPRSLRTTRP